MILEKYGPMRHWILHHGLHRNKKLSLLCDTVKIDRTVDETESSVGSFNVEILATETDTGRKIVIENQLEDTNHDYLGKTITYVAVKFNVVERPNDWARETKKRTAL